MNWKISKLKNKKIIGAALIACFAIGALVSSWSDTSTGESEVKKEMKEMVLVHHYPEKIDTIRVLLLADDGTIYHKSKDAKKEGDLTYFCDKDGNTKGLGYPGIMEIHSEAQGYVFVNEVDVEDYVARVLPSEMPESFGLNALKAQAICARTYIYSLSKERGYMDYNALVDDSINFQEYNKLPTTTLSDQACQETHGQILVKNYSAVESLYHSTSCGFTQTGDIFGNKYDTELLQSKYIGVPATADKNSAAHPIDFDSYLRTVDNFAFEKDEKYFRWMIRINVDEKLDSIKNRIISMKEDDPKNIIYEGDGPSGKITHMDLVERSKGGAITSLMLTFENGTVTISDQLEIRRILGAGITQVFLNDGSRPEGVTSLYSSAFTWDVGQNGNYVLYGGGYGHGVGMSQYGAKDLSEAGFSYTDILEFFYTDAIVYPLD